MKHFKLFFALFAMLALNVGNAWAEEVTANFGWSNWDDVTESFSGNAKDEVTQTVDGVVVTYTQNGASLYANNTALRFYKSNTLKFDAPSNYSITSITFACIAYKTDITSNTGTCTATSSELSWSGDASSVTFTRPSGVSGYATITSATITLSSASGETPEPDPDPEPDPTPGTGETWTLVTNASDLKAGDIIVIASNTKGRVASNTITSDYMGEVSTTFSADKTTITTLPAEAAQLTIGGTSGAWTLTYDGKQLGATAVKKVAWDNGTKTWSITIANDGGATIQNGMSTYGRFLHNVSSTRFTTYTSDANSSMLLPQIYKKVTSSGGEDPVTPTQLSAPANLTEGEITETSATLSWDAVDNASNYSVTINGNTATANSNSYSATGLTAGTEYTWSVVAKGDGTNYADSEAAEHTFTTTTATITPEPGTGSETATATLTFDADKANRTSYSTTQQVWAQNGVTFTNNKASSTSNIGDYGNPVRLYQSSEIVVECSKGNMTKIVFTASSTSYATAMSTSLGNSLGTVTTEGNDVILTLSTPATATSAISLSAQVRLNSITVTYEKVVSADPVITCGNVNFGVVSANVNTTKELVVEAENLTENITAVLTSGTNFAVSGDLTTAGGTLTLSVTATEEGTYTDKLTLTSGTTIKEVEVSATVVVCQGKGTEENPYTINDVIKLANPSPTITAWVEGYIVGVMKDSKLAAPDSETYANIVLATSATETEKFVPVALPVGDIREALNLVDHSEYLGKKVAVYGTLENYYSTTGVKNVTNYQWVSTEGDVAAPVIEGDEYFEESTTITITAAEGTTIYYTTDGNTPDKTATQYSAPFTINATTTVKAIAYDATDNASAVAEMTFTKHDLVNVATAMAAAKDEIVYLKPFDVVYAVTGKEYVYIKDESGFGLIYDTDLANQLLNGDRVEGFVGKSSPYRSLPELKAHNTENMTITHGTAVEPTEFTTVPATSHVNQYVVFKNVTFDEDVVFNSSTATNATFKLNTNDVTMRNSFKFDVAFEADKTYDIYGAIATYQATESDPIEVQVYYLNSAEAGQEVVTYTVTYDANGAYGNVPTDLANYAAGQQVTVAGQGEMTYENHMFTGWKYNGTIYQAGDKFNMPADDVTLVAQWEEVKTYDQGAWVLVTDASELAVDDDVIIAAANDNYALGTEQKSNNRGTGTIVKGSNVALLESKVQILTLENGNQSGTLALSTGNGYLYAASSSSNHLKTETTLSNNSSWTIEINEAVATIEAQGTNTHNLLQYNSTSNIFSCYSSEQQPVAIYEYNPNERVITFDVNGGEAYAHTYVATTGGGTLTLPTDVPTHAAEGQLFSSWNDKQDGSGNTYDAGTTYQFTEHTTLYAQWAVADAYHVTYSIAGASGTTPVDANHYYGGETVTLASQGDLVNPGHIFAGWNVVDANNTEILVTENTFIMPQSDVTATAKWVRKINDKWVLVTSTEQLIVGDKYVIACNTKNAIAGKIVDNTYMQHIDATFSEDKSVIVACNEDPQILTLGKEDDLWTFINDDGKYLSDENKTLKWAEEKYNWTIVIEDEYTAIAIPDYAIYYNPSAPRFKTYDIDINNMLDIQLYRLIPNQVVTGEKKTDNDVPQHSNVTVENGGDLFVEKSDTQYGDVYINNGGSVEVDDNAQLTVNNLYISTTMGTTTSGQLNTAAENIIVNGDAFIDITLGKNGDPSQWHAFTVPFPVDAMNGVYDLNDNKLTNEVNYAIMDYHGDLRANGQYGWKKYRGILVPGTFYLMTVDGDRTTYRFKKVKGAELIAPATKELKAYTGSGDATKDHGWNGVGNPTLMHGKVAYDAQILDPESYTYVLVPASSAHFFTVGTPFFIQAEPDDEEVTIASEVSGSLAPARRAAAAVENIKVMLGNSDYTDRLYVSASEDATNEYEIGKDLAKMTMTKTPSVPQIFALAYDTRLCMIDAPMANNEAVVALNLYAPANGEYTLSVEAQDNEKVYLLHDGTFVWDLSMSEYPITLNKGDNAGYSILVHRADAPTSVETIDGTNNQTEKLIHNGNLYILHNGKVFDAVGTMLK